MDQQTSDNQGNFKDHFLNKGQAAAYVRERMLDIADFEPSKKTEMKIPYWTS